MNPYFTALAGAATRILLWVVAGALVGLGVSPEVQAQVNEFVGSDPTNAAMAVAGLAVVWYGKTKLSKGQT